MHSVIFSLTDLNLSFKVHGYIKVVDCDMLFC